MLRIMFTNEEMKKTFTDWAATAQGMVAGFRAVYSKLVDDPWIEQLVNDLKDESDEFRLWWAQHNVKAEESRLKTIIHPSLGYLNFEETSFMVADHTSLRMSVFTPQAGTGTKEKIIQFLLSGQSEF